MYLIPDSDNIVYITSKIEHKSTYAHMSEVILRNEIMKGRRSGSGSGQGASEFGIEIEIEKKGWGYHIWGEKKWLCRWQHQQK